MKKLSEIQKNVQCRNCINKTFDRCKNNDMYLIRNHCNNYIPNDEFKELIGYRDIKRIHVDVCNHTYIYLNNY